MCILFCACSHVTVHLPHWLMGIFATAKTWWCYFCRCMVRSCQLLILYVFSVCAAILDVDLSWPVFIWSWVEQRRLCCVLCFGLLCVCLEGRGKCWGWPERSRRLPESQYSEQTLLECITKHYRWDIYLFGWVKCMYILIMIHNQSKSISVSIKINTKEVEIMNQVENWAHHSE